MMKIKVSKLKLVLVGFEIPGREDSGRVRLRRDSIFLLGRSKVSASRGITGLSSPKFTFILTHILTTVFPLEISKFTVVNADVKCMKQAQNRHADDFQKVSTNTRILLQRAKNNPSSCVGEMCYFKYKHF